MRKKSAAAGMGWGKESRSMLLYRNMLLTCLLHVRLMDIFQQKKNKKHQS